MGSAKMELKRINGLQLRLFKSDHSSSLFVIHTTLRIG